MLRVLAVLEPCLSEIDTALFVASMRKKKQRYSLHAPYGYMFRPNGKIIQHRKEQKVINAILLLYKDGVSLRHMEALLRESGVRNRAGKPFAATQLGVLFRRYSKSRRIV